MLGLLAPLLVAWLAAAVVGAVVEGLFWLTVAGLVLFLVTSAVARSRWERRTGPAPH